MPRLMMLLGYYISAMPTGSSPVGSTTKRTMFQHLGQLVLRHARQHPEQQRLWMRGKSESERVEGPNHVSEAWVRLDLFEEEVQ